MSGLPFGPGSAESPGGGRGRQGSRGVVREVEAKGEGGGENSRRFFQEGRESERGVEGRTGRLPPEGRRVTGRGWIRMTFELQDPSVKAVGLGPPLYTGLNRRVTPPLATGRAWRGRRVTPPCDRSGPPPGNCPSENLGGAGRGAGGRENAPLKSPRRSGPRPAGFFRSFEDGNKMCLCKIHLC
jgi:hypothetical protein